MISLRKFIEFTVPEASEYLKSKGPISRWFMKLRDMSVPAGLNKFCTYVLDIATPDLKIPSCKIYKKNMKYGLLVVGFSLNLNEIVIERWGLEKQRLILCLNLDGSISKIFWKGGRDSTMTEIKNIKKLSDAFDSNKDIS